MVAKKSKKLPEGVGKRIIETLQNQELDTNFDEELGSETNENIEVLKEVSLKDVLEEISEEEILEETSEIETEAEIEEIKEVEKVEYSEPKVSAAPHIESYQPQEVYEQKEYTGFGVSDIDTLLTLISQLPSGVTKQTGALIIRQTMEAMGISMNKVLGDAQTVQEDLEHSIRNNVNVIEEYRTKIKILEQEIQKFRKKSHELEDVISLFILSGDKR